MAKSYFAFWNFMEFFFPNPFNLQLGEPTDAEPADKESQRSLPPRTVGRTKGMRQSLACDALSISPLCIVFFIIENQKHFIL